MKKRWAPFNTDTKPLRLSKMMGVPEMQQMRVVNVDRDDKDKMFESRCEWTSSSSWLAKWSRIFDGRR